MMYIKNFVSLPCFGMWRIENLMMTQIMWCGWAAAVEQMRRGSETFMLQVMRILIPAMVVTVLMLMVPSGICFDLIFDAIWQTVFENMCRSRRHKNIRQPALPMYRRTETRVCINVSPFTTLPPSSTLTCTLLTVARARQCQQGAFLSVHLAPTG